tara:strand:- start:1510 stop:2070 length:561 start_codon:yes stop_codon:yes gene_type:complete
MSTKGILILAAVFMVAFGLLGMGRCGYREIESIQSLEKAGVEINRRFPSVESFSPATLLLYQKSGQAVLLIDAREPGEFALSHLPGAVNLGNVTAVKAYLATLNPSPSLIVIYGAIGFRSAELADQLQQSGVAGVKHLEGSVFRWANEGNPLVGQGDIPTNQVHPYNKTWGKLLNPEYRANPGAEE